MVPPCSDRISRVPPYSRIFEPLRIRGYHPLWPDFPDCFAYLPKTTGLLRVRSPLLAESLLMSFPPGTEMFQFPGFASPTYVFSERYPSLGGLPHSDIHGSTPARGSPWLFAACHVLHRLLVPRHPPNALLILDIPDIVPPRSNPAEPCLTMHRNHPQGIRIIPFSLCVFRTHPVSPAGHPADRSHDRPPIQPAKPLTAPLNPRRPTVGGPPDLNAHAPRSRQHARSDKSAEQRDPPIDPKTDTRVTRAQRRTRT